MGTDCDQVVGIEYLQAFEKEAQSPGDRCQFTGNGWCKGDAMKFITAIGKQLLDLCRANAARLRIGGIEPKIVSEDHATGFPRGRVGTSENTQHYYPQIAQI